MKIYVERKWKRNGYIISDVYIDGAWFCNVLESAALAIPECNTKVALRYSPHFKKIRPWLTKVPGRMSILIHEGNMVADTKGCLLVGLNKTVGKVVESQKYLKLLMDMISKEYKNGGIVMLQVVNHYSRKK